MNEYNVFEEPFFREMKLNELSFPLLVDLLGRDELNVYSENTVLYRANEWVMKNGPINPLQMLLLSRCIRICNLSPFYKEKILQRIEWLIISQETRFRMEPRRPVNPDICMENGFTHYFMESREQLFQEKFKDWCISREDVFSVPLVSSQPSVEAGYEFTTLAKIHRNGAFSMELKCEVNLGTGIVPFDKYCRCEMEVRIGQNFGTYHWTMYQNEPHFITELFPPNDTITVDGLLERFRDFFFCWSVTLDGEGTRTIDSPNPPSFRYNTLGEHVFGV